MDFSGSIFQEFCPEFKLLLMGLLKSKNKYFPEHLAMAASDRSLDQEEKHFFIVFTFTVLCNPLKITTCFVYLKKIKSTFKKHQT